MSGSAEELMLMTRENQALTSELMVEGDSEREIGSLMMIIVMMVIMLLMIVTIVIISNSDDDGDNNNFYYRPV